jgi:hypothetical protein
MASAASSPFAADPDCLGLAMRIIKEGVPDFTEEQRRRIAANPAFRKRLVQVEQCRKSAPKRGIDFGCYVKSFANEEHAALRQCWTTSNRSQADCIEQIYNTCDRLKQSWDALIISAAPEALEI